MISASGRSHLFPGELVVTTVAVAELPLDARVEIEFVAAAKGD